MTDTLSSLNSSTSNWKLQQDAELTSVLEKFARSVSKQCDDAEKKMLEITEGSQSLLAKIDWIDSQLKNLAQSKLIEQLVSDEPTVTNNGRATPKQSSTIDQVETVQMAVTKALIVRPIRGSTIHLISSSEPEKSVIVPRQLRECDMNKKESQIITPTTLPIQSEIAGQIEKATSVQVLIPSTVIKPIAPVETEPVIIAGAEHAQRSPDTQQTGRRGIFDSSSEDEMSRHEEQKKKTPFESSVDSRVSQKSANANSLASPRSENENATTFSASNDLSQKPSPEMPKKPTLGDSRTALAGAIAAEIANRNKKKALVAEEVAAVPSVEPKRQQVPPPLKQEEPQLVARQVAPEYIPPIDRLESAKQPNLTTQNIASARPQTTFTSKPAPVAPPTQASTAPTREPFIVTSNIPSNSKSLFDSDSDSEDLFNSKKPVLAKVIAKTPSVAETGTVKQSTKTSKLGTQKAARAVHVKSLFESDSDDEDLFLSTRTKYKSTEQKKAPNPVTVANVRADSVATVPTETKKVEKETNVPVQPEKSSVKKEEPVRVESKPAKSSIFDDDDDGDLFTAVKKSVPKVAPTQTQNTSRSIFDDDEDNSESLFGSLSSGPKKLPAQNAPSASTQGKLAQVVNDSTPTVTNLNSSQKPNEAKKTPKSIFDDDSDDESLFRPKSVKPVAVVSAGSRPPVPESESKKPSEDPLSEKASSVEANSKVVQSEQEEMIKAPGKLKIGAFNDKLTSALLVGPPKSAAEKAKTTESKKEDKTPAKEIVKPQVKSEESYNTALKNRPRGPKRRPPTRKSDSDKEKASSNGNSENECDPLGVNK